MKKFFVSAIILTLLLTGLFSQNVVASDTGYKFYTDLDSLNPSTDPTNKFLAYEVTGDGEVSVRAAHRNENAQDTMPVLFPTDTKLVIPETVLGEDGNTYKVTSLAEGYYWATALLAAFHHEDTITEATIPSSITSISPYAFFYCSKLTNIVIPYGVTSIGNNAFGRCSSLKTLNIPNTLIALGENAIPNDVKIHIFSENPDATEEDFITTINVLKGAGFSMENITLNIPEKPDSNDVTKDYLGELNENLREAIAAGGEQTVAWNEGTALPYSIMKTLKDNPQITLVFSCKYDDVDMKVTIHGKDIILDEKIPWYGIKFLNSIYGNGNALNSVSSDAYRVVSGDTLSTIARRFNISLSKLVLLNNIADPIYIRVGQVLNLGDGVRGSF